jgi:hypothetical protein
MLHPSRCLIVLLMITLLMIMSIMAATTVAMATSAQQICVMVDTNNVNTFANNDICDALPFDHHLRQQHQCIANNNNNNCYANSTTEPLSNNCLVAATTIKSKGATAVNDVNATTSTTASTADDNEGDQRTPLTRAELEEMVYEDLTTSLTFAAIVTIAARFRSLLIG